MKAALHVHYTNWANQICYNTHLLACTTKDHNGETIHLNSAKMAQRNVKGERERERGSKKYIEHVMKAVHVASDFISTW